MWPASQNKRNKKKLGGTGGPSWTNLWAYQLRRGSVNSLTSNGQSAAAYPQLRYTTSVHHFRYAVTPTVNQHGPIRQSIIPYGVSSIGHLRYWYLR